LGRLIRSHSLDRRRVKFPACFTVVIRYHSLDRRRGEFPACFTVAGWLRHRGSATRSETYVRSPHVGALRCTTRLGNAHGTEFQEVLYRYHPWFGREVGVHGIVAKCDGVYFRCAVAGGHGDRWLEVPAWMFERASCPGDLQLTAVPFVSLDALAELSALLDRALKTPTASSNVPLSGASRSSHDQIRGEARASDDGDGGDQRQAQAAARASADGPVRQRQAGGRRRAALAGAAGASTLSADGADGTADSRPRRHGRSASSKGGRR